MHLNVYFIMQISILLPAKIQKLQATGPLAYKFVHIAIYCW